MVGRDLVLTEVVGCSCVRGGEPDDATPYFAQTA